MSGKVFMAFAKGSESTEGIEIKRFIGVGASYVLAVNPNKKDLEKLYARELDKEPEYIGESEVGPEGNKKTVAQVRIDFIVKPDPEKYGIETVVKATYFLRNAPRMKNDGTKVQVIDKYGRTAWVTVEQAKAKEIPVYKNGPANIDKDYRPCYIGEEDLTNFIKSYLNIPNVMKYVNNTWVMVDKPEDCEARLEKIDAYFKGDFNELKSIIGFQPNNKVKLLYGVKTTTENKQYQDIYIQYPMKNGVSDYSKLDADLQERKANGGYANTEFEICDLKEYKVEATNLSKEPSDLPFESKSDSPWF